MLGAHDARLVAGLHGPSRTAHLTDQAKRERSTLLSNERKRFVPEEDAVELAQIRLKEFERTRLICR